ncbi:hypothetical protein BD413DRAFT_247362 [Trametes elegans]|nr:hypothetical protein BD413DRAFT_247362 [Trametes elegans]
MPSIGNPGDLSARHWPNQWVEESMVHSTPPSLASGSGFFPEQSSPIHSSWAYGSSHLATLDVPYYPADHHLPEPSWHLSPGDHTAGTFPLVFPAQPQASRSARQSVPKPSNHPPTKPIMAEPANSLDNSLRRLEALSASMLAMAASVPSSPGPGTSDTHSAADSDKRRIGNFEDKTNAGYFDLAAPTVSPSPTLSCPPPNPACTVVVAHLPKRFRKRIFVQTWAKRHGTVTRIEVDTKAGKALVQYQTARQAEAAFLSLRLRGDGKEHIRVYFYKGSAPPLAVLSTPVGLAEVEERELEEGEVLETPVTPIKAKTKNKNKKGKKKAQALEQRITEPGKAPRFSEHALSVPSPTPLLSAAPRPSLEERFSNVPPMSDGVWEEAMDLDSDEESRKFPLPLSPELVTTTLAPQPSDAAMDDWEADMDIAASSPMHEGKDSTSRRLKLKRMWQSLSGNFDDDGTGADKNALQTRKRELQAAIAKTKSQLAAQKVLATSSATSSGTSSTPEPVTPVALSERAFVDVAIVARPQASAQAMDIVQEDRVAVPDETLSKNGKAAAVNLDDLAVSFITESIQTAIASPSRPPKPASPLAPTGVLHPPPISMPTPVAPSTSSPAASSAATPSAPSTPSTPQLSEAAQLLAKKKRLEEYITTSKSLLAKIGAAKTKTEKDMLMRLLKQKQRAMDGEMQSGRASPATSGPGVHTLAPKPTPFRWPETPREMFIDISDDEADVALSASSAHR